MGMSFSIPSVSAITADIDLISSAACPHPSKVSALNRLTRLLEHHEAQGIVGPLVLAEATVEKYAVALRRDGGLAIPVLDLFTYAVAAHEVGGARVLPLALDWMGREPLASLELLCQVLRLPKAQVKLLEVGGVDALKGFLDTSPDASEPRICLAVMKILSTISRHTELSRAMAKANLTSNLIDASCHGVAYNEGQKHALRALANLCRWDAVLDLIHSQHSLRDLYALSHATSRLPLALVYAQCSIYQTEMIPTDPAVCLRLLNTLLHSGFEENVMVAAWAIANYSAFPAFRAVLVKNAALPAVLNLSRRVKEVRLWRSVVVCASRVMYGSLEDRELCLRLGLVSLLIDLMDGCLAKVSGNVEDAICVDVRNIDSLLDTDQKERMRTWTLALGCLSSLMDSFASACLEFMEHEGYVMFPAMLAADDNPEGQEYAALIISHLLRHDDANANVFLEGATGHIVRAMGRTRLPSVQLGCAKAISELLRTQKGKVDGPRVLGQHHGVDLCVRVAAECAQNNMSLLRTILDILVRACVLSSAVAVVIGHVHYNKVTTRFMSKPELSKDTLRLFSRILEAGHAHEGVSTALLRLETSVTYVVGHLRETMNAGAAAVIAMWSMDAEVAGVLARYKDTVPALLHALAVHADIQQLVLHGLANILLACGGDKNTVEIVVTAWDTLFDVYPEAPLASKVHILRCVIGLGTHPMPRHLGVRTELFVIILRDSMSGNKTLATLSLDVFKTLLEHQSGAVCQEFVYFGICEELFRCMNVFPDLAPRATLALKIVLERTETFSDRLTQNIVDGFWATVLDEMTTWGHATALMQCLGVIKEKTSCFDMRVLPNTGALFDFITEDPHIEVRCAAIHLVVRDTDVLKCRQNARAILCEALGNAADVCNELDRVYRDLLGTLEGVSGAGLTHVDRHKLLTSVNENETQLLMALDIVRNACAGLYDILSYVDPDERAQSAGNILSLSGSGWETLLGVGMLATRLSTDCDQSISRLCLGLAIETSPKLFVGSGGIQLAVTVLASPTVSNEVRNLAAAALQACCRVDFFSECVVRESGLQVLLGVITRFEAHADNRALLADILIVISVLCSSEPDIAMLFIAKGHLATVRAIQLHFLKLPGSEALHQAITRVIAALFIIHDSHILGIPLSTKQEAAGALLAYMSSPFTKVVRSSAIVLCDLCAKDVHMPECVVASSSLPLLMDAVTSHDPLCIREAVRVLVTASRRPELKKLLRSRLPLLLTHLCAAVTHESIHPQLLSPVLEYLSQNVVDDDGAAAQQMQSIRPNLLHLFTSATTIDDKVYVLILIKAVLPTRENVGQLVQRLLGIVHTDHATLQRLTLDVLLTLSQSPFAPEVASQPSLVNTYFKFFKKPDAREVLLETLSHLAAFPAIQQSLVSISDESFGFLLAFLVDVSPDATASAVQALLVLNSSLQNVAKYIPARQQRVLDALFMSFRGSPRHTARCALTLHGIASALPTVLKSYSPAQADALCRDTLSGVKPFIGSKHPAGAGGRDTDRGVLFDPSGVVRKAFAVEDDKLWNSLPEWKRESSALTTVSLRCLEWNLSLACAVAVAVHNPALAAQYIAVEDVLGYFTSISDKFVHIWAAKMLAAMSRLRPQHEVLLCHRDVSIIPSLLTHSIAGVAHAAAFVLSQLSDNIRAHRKLVQLVDIDHVCRIANAILDDVVSVFSPAVLFQLGRFMCNVSGSVHYQNQLERGGRTSIARFQNDLTLHRLGEVFEVSAAWKGALVDPSWVPAENKQTENAMTLEACVDTLMQARTVRVAHSLEVTTSALCVYSRTEARKVKATLATRCENPVQVLVWHLQNANCTLNILWTLFFLCALDPTFGELILADNVMPFITIAAKSDVISVNYVCCKLLCLMWTSPQSQTVFSRARHPLKAITEPFRWVVV